ncbi:MAG: hypothetical protein JW757_01155 [Anaerolineales bacterium]|nr:hypothetical protein [Anaerolineales bacterium]
MDKRALILLFVLGLAVGLAGSLLQTNPGYMDAYYYFYTGQQLAHGEGFTEMLLWNYLDDPAGIPHPSHTYWQPAVSLLTAAGIRLFSGIMPEFKAAQVILVLVVALIPPVTAGLAYSLSGRKPLAWLAGVLAAFTGFYQPFWTTTDSLGLVMLLGGVFFWVVAGMKSRPKRQAVVLGLIAGLMHLTRVEGLLWLGMAGLGVLFNLHGSKADCSFKQRFRRMFTREYFVLGVLTVAGYALVMAPWFLRNYFAFGGLFAPGGSRALWVEEYDQLFAYPASILTPEHLLASGWEAVLSGRIEALWQNLQKSFVAVGVVVPGILAVVGAWQWRHRREIRLGVIGWAILYGVMSLVFPYSGMRGSYFHAAASFVPLVLATAPAGLDAVVAALLRLFKHWEAGRIRPLMVGLLLVWVIGFTAVSYLSGVVGFDGGEVIQWNRTESSYQAVGGFLEEAGAGLDEIVLSINPPAFVVVTGMPAVGMPDGGPEVIHQVVNDYDVRWVLVEGTPKMEEAAFFSSLTSSSLLEIQAEIGGITILKRIDP